MSMKSVLNALQMLNEYEDCQARQRRLKLTGIACEADWECSSADFSAAVRLYGPAGVLREGPPDVQL